MKITLFNLRLTLSIIYFRFFLKGISLYGIETIISELNLPSVIFNFFIILHTGLDLYLFFFLYLFLNKFLKFNNANWLIIAIIIIQVIYIGYSIYRIDKIAFEDWETIFLNTSAIVFYMINVVYCFKLFAYRYLFKKQITFYAFCQLIGITVQISFPYLVIYLFEEHFDNLKLFSDIVGFLPYFALIILYYKAIKTTPKMNEGFPEILDSGEYSV